MSAINTRGAESKQCGDTLSRLIYAISTRGAQSKQSEDTLSTQGLLLASLWVYDTISRDGRVREVRRDVLD